MFSIESLHYLCEKYGMEMVGKWQFGTDIMDLYRICMVQNNEQMNEIIAEKLYNCLDKMQLILDENNFCSEIHTVLRCK